MSSLLSVSALMSLNWIYWMYCKICKQHFLVQNLEYYSPLLFFTTRSLRCGGASSRLVQISPSISPWNVSSRAMAAQESVPGGAEPDVEERRTPSPIDLYIHQVAGAEANNERTILDALNVDCWSLVLDFLSIQEIIRTERVSRQWQGVVLQYLSHVRFGIMHPLFGTNHRHNFLMLLDTAEKVSSFTSWTSKLGAAVVNLHWRFEEGMETVRENCPNLEAIMLFVPPKIKPISSQNEYFSCLQRFCGYYCGDISDACVSQFLSGNALEEVKILFNHSITGDCLNTIKSSKLTSLVFKRCIGLRLPPLLRAADRLGGLTKLVLKRVPTEIWKNTHLFLGKMPRLEYLRIQSSYQSDRRSDDLLGNVFFEAVCLLSCLEYLYVDYDTCDKHLEAVACCCEKLQNLHLSRCREVTGFGLDAVCRLAGARLTALSVFGSVRVSDDDAVACVRACPSLTSLALDGCTELSNELPDRVAAARRALAVTSRLNLHLYGDFWCTRHEEVLKVDTSTPSYDSDWVHERG